MRRSKKTSPLLPPAATSSFSSASDPATQYRGQGGVPRAKKMLMGHLPREIYHRVYFDIRQQLKTVTEGPSLGRSSRTVPGEVLSFYVWPYAGRVDSQRWEWFAADFI